MKITIEAEPKEIAALVLAVQERREKIHIKTVNFDGLDDLLGTIPNRNPDNTIDKNN